MKSLLLSAAAGWLVRILAIIVNVVGIPPVLQSLGPTRFGVVLIAMGIGSLVGIGNVGIGRVVGIAVARFYLKSPMFVSKVVSYATVVAVTFHTVFFVMCAVALLVLARHVELGPDSVEYRPEFVVSTIAVFFAASVWFALSVFEGVDAGQHRLVRLYWYQALSYALTLTLILTMFRRMPSILFATLLLSAGYVVGNVMHAFDVWIRHRNLFRWPARQPRQLVRALLAGSLDFAIIGFVVGITFQLTTGIAGLIVGPDAIIDLGIFMRIVASLGGIIFAVTTPLSNLIASRISHGDDRGAFDATILTGGGLLAGCAIAAIGFDIFGERLLTLWLKTTTSYEPLFRIMASLLIFSTGAYAYAVAVAIGFGGVKRVARIHMLAGAAVLPAAYFCYAIFGQAGVLMSMNFILAAMAIACLLTGNRAQSLRAGTAT
jgi:O-antigen/teichoic acid export membrane protein